MLARYNAYSSFFSALNEKGSSNSYKNALEMARDFKSNRYASQVYPDLAQIEYEAAALYQVFLDSKHESKKLKDSGLIEMLTFTSQLLLMHYQSYPKKKDVKLHEDRLQSLRFFLEIESPEPSKPNDMKSRFDWVIASVQKNFEDFWSLLCNPALLRDQLGWTNLARIFWIFYHFSINEVILIVKDAPFLDKLGQMLGSPIDLDAFSNLLNAPNDFLYVLSVVFFGVRLLIDVVMLAKHTWSDEMETVEPTTSWQRFCAELEKRYPNIMNCIVWGGVNAATNYSSFFGIPAPYVMPIVAGVLMFDMSLALLMWHRQDQSYISSLKVLEEQIEAIKQRSGISEDQCLAVLEKQVKVLQDRRDVDNEVFKFNSLAALIMMSSFATSLILTAPIAILACYLVCCFSLSLYSCAEPGKGEYAQYLMASRNLAYAQNRQGEFSAEQLQQLAVKSNQAFEHLQYIILERALAPLALLTAFAINPLLGLALMTAYLGYKINEGFVCETAVTEPGPTLNQFSLFKNSPDGPGGPGGSGALEQEVISDNILIPNAVGVLS